MASMIGFIGSLPPHFYDKEKSGIPAGVYRWQENKSYTDNLRQLPFDDQMRCALDHAIALAYYIVFYGKRCHDVVNEFIQEFTNDIQFRLIPQGQREGLTELRTTLLADLNNLVKFIKTQQWEDVHIGLIQEFLANGPYDATPMAFRNMPNHIPFLMWMNKHRDPNYSTFTYKELGIIAFGIDAWYCGPWVLYVKNYFIGTSFSADETPIDESSRTVAILPYLSHFNLSKIPFETVIGGIGQMCFHYDVRRSGTTNTQRLAAAILSKTMGLATLSGCQLGYGTDMDWLKHGFFEHLKAFLKYANRQYGMVAKSKEVLVRLFSCIAETKEQKDSAAYIREQGGSASADHLAAYQKHLGGLEALQLISQSPTLLSAQSQVADSAESKNGNEQKDDAGEKPAESNSNEETNASKDEEGDTTQDELEEDDTSAKDNGSETDAPAEGSGNLMTRGTRVLTNLQPKPRVGIFSVPTLKTCQLRRRPSILPTTKGSSLRSPIRTTKPRILLCSARS